MVPLLLLVFLQGPAATPNHVVYEGVIYDRGKTIGTAILLEVSGSTVTGWIQKHDFLPIEGGTVSESGFAFKAAGNGYQMNTRSNRIVYGGPDGSGDQRLNRM